MPPFQLATSEDLRRWIPSQETVAPEDMEACLQASTRLIQRITGRTFEKRAITERFSGRLADGPNKEVLRLAASQAPIDLGVPVTVVENGVTLTVASAYSTSAQVFVDAGDRNAVLPACPRLVRVGRCWAEGTNNVDVTWTGGFTGPEDEEDPFPIDIVRCCSYLGWDIIKTPAKAGKSSRSTGQGSSSFAPEWPLWVRECLKYWTR